MDRADRLGARTLTARCLLEIERMRRPAAARLPELRRRLLVVEAAHDRIADNQRNRRVAAAGRWATAAASSPSTPSISCSPSRAGAEVIETLIDWMQTGGTT